MAYKELEICQVSRETTEIKIVAGQVQNRRLRKESVNLNLKIDQ